mgnify:CR=1 FL=1
MANPFRPNIRIELVKHDKVLDFYQIAVLLILSTLYQSITNSKIYRGNDLVTVLLTDVCDHLLVR